MSLLLMQEKFCSAGMSVFVVQQGCVGGVHMLVILVTPAMRVRAVRACCACQGIKRTFNIIHVLFFSFMMRFSPRYPRHAGTHCCVHAA